MIAKIEVDEKGSLRLYPADANYDFIYRAAAGVDWNKEGRFLHARELGEWTSQVWFRQILSVVASEYGDQLEIGPKTEWSKVPEDVRREIED